MEKYLEGNPESLYIRAYIELLDLFVQYQMRAGSNARHTVQALRWTFYSRLILRPQHFCLTTCTYQYAPAEVKGEHLYEAASRRSFFSLKRSVQANMDSSCVPPEKYPTSVLKPLERTRTYKGIRGALTNTGRPECYGESRRRTAAFYKWRDFRC